VPPNPGAITCELTFEKKDRKKTNHNTTGRKAKKGAVNAISKKEYGSKEECQEETKEPAHGDTLMGKKLIPGNAAKNRPRRGKVGEIVRPIWAAKQGTSL